MALRARRRLLVAAGPGRARQPGARAPRRAEQQGEQEQHARGPFHRRHFIRDGETSNLWNSWRNRTIPPSRSAARGLLVGLFEALRRQWRRRGQARPGNPWTDRARARRGATTPERPQ